MALQKQAVVELVQTQRGQGRTVGEVLGSVGVARSSTTGGRRGREQKRASGKVGMR